MKNLSKLSFLIFFFSLFTVTTVFANGKPVPTSKTPAITPTSSQAVVLASVDIQNAKINSQKDNSFNISFSLTNGEGLQTGVKYSVQLLKQITKGEFIVDEKIYDESLTLNPNTTVQKEITYNAPLFLNGDYTLIIASNNTNGFPFAVAGLGRVKLIATQEGINILPETCSLKVADKSYDLNQTVGISQSENMTLTCMALNFSKSDHDFAVPAYETRYRSSYGEVVKQIGGDVTPVSFKAHEQKSFTVTLPKATLPQSYNLAVTLDKSNTINIHYFITGDIATIMSIALDKDFYMKGDTALLSFVYSVSATSPITASIKLSDGKGSSCADSQTKILDTSSPKLDISIPITSDCTNPKVNLNLTDDKGTVLDQKEFTVKTTSVDAPKITNNLLIIIIIIILIIIIIAYIYMKKKKLSMSAPISVLFFLIALSIFFPTSKASAATYSVGTGLVAVLSQGINDNGSNGSNYSGVSYPFPSGSISASGYLMETAHSGHYPGGITVSAAAASGSPEGSTYTIYSRDTSGGESSSTASVPVPDYNSTNYNLLFTFTPYGTSSSTRRIPFTTAPVPTVTVSANPSIITIGGSSVVTWSSLNAQTCQCSSPTNTYYACISFPGGLSGTFTTPSITTFPATITITCNN